MSLFLACLLAASIAEGHPASACNSAAEAFVASLDGVQRPRAQWPFAQALRDQWSYRPGSAFRRHGIRAGELDDGQRSRAQALLGCALSSQGYLKASGIMQLDALVRERAGEIVMNDGRQPVEIGPEWYWYTLFGVPGADAPWGFQVEGHHLAVNVTLVDGRIAATPAFFGAWPATVESGPLAGSRLLRGEEERAFAFVALLDDRQRRRMVISEAKAAGLFTSPERAATLARYEGLPGSALSGAQREALMGLVAEYVGNLDPAIAGPWLATIRAELPQLHVAWMGPTQPGRGSYYRLHGPSVLIEFDHAPDIRRRGLPPDPNHVHTILRRPGADLGEDLLARHYRRAAHHRD